MVRAEILPMNLPFLGMYTSWFQRLSLTERRLFIVFAFVILGSVYFNGFLKGTFKQIAALKKEYTENQKRSQALISDFPNLVQARGELQTLQQNIDRMRNQAADVESRLIGPDEIPQVLTELVKSAQGLSVDFQSIKQKTQQDKEGFSRFIVDCRFDASYENAASYIKRVERMSPLIKLTRVQLSPSKSDPRNLVNAALQLTTIMANTPTGKAQLLFSKPEDIKPLKISRNPLTPRFGVADQIEGKAFKVMGITYRKSGISTAIINDTVVKVGDEVDRCRVESILPDSVVINEAGQSRVLKVER